MMRLAIIATPAALPDLQPAPGALDGDAIRSRLPLLGAGFRVVDLDPSVDLAEQLDILFEKEALAPGTPVLFYASCAVALNARGELFLCLDPASPDTGDALGDIALVFSDHAPGPVAFVIECKHPPSSNDPFPAASVVSAGKEAIVAAGAGRGGSGIELLITARPLGEELDERPSPLTRALIEALDEAAPDVGLTLSSFFSELQSTERLIGEVPGFAYVRAKKRFVLLPGAKPEAEPPGASERPAARSAPPAGQAIAPARKSEPRPPATSPPAKPAASDRPNVAPAVAASVMPPPGASIVPPPDGGSIDAFHEHVAVGDALMLAMDPEGALAAFKRALGQLGQRDATARADTYVRIARVKEHQEKRREAIASYEKAIQLAPAHPGALEKLIDLNVSESDWRAVQSAEDHLLLTLTTNEERFGRLLEFGARWLWVADDIQEAQGERWREERVPMLERARLCYERARAIRPDDTSVLERLRRLYESVEAIEEAIATRRTLAELTADDRARAEQYFSLGNYCFDELKREELGMELFDLALGSDPTLLEPLALIARNLADRQEWGELEEVYRKMLDRAERIQQTGVRRELTWELCRRLGLLFRDHLEDPVIALDAFEDAVAEKKTDLGTRLTTAELARSLGRHDRAAVHLQAAACLDPSRLATFHDLFDTFQKLRKPDQAYAAASVTMHLESAEPRERFVFEENHADGLPKPSQVMRDEGWDLLRVRGRDGHVEAVFTALARTAMAARLSQLAAEGRLPALDPTARQDPQKSSMAIVRSFAWASHFLGVRAPAIYLHPADDVGLMAVMAEEASAVAGGRVQRGCSPVELAFLAGRHLAYHHGVHRLLLYYPTIEELSACFLVGVKLSLPELPIPGASRAGVLDLAARIDGALTPTERVELTRAVRAFQAAGGRTDIAAWVADVERCATRAGYLLAGDLDVTAKILRAEPRVVVSLEDKLADLLGFAVSEEHHLLREELGIAIQP